ncbi:ABC transporter ATP-binding protein [Seleniivibrio woodruffii]|uniref:Nucleoside ABC transporter ATP-binding protein n=1 Tax=Seleniivibrio woodruffii TaxID=1078050 RepID=A0A4R1K9L5_9BACT|nr:ABC transporter ATP-binding protein [Seleniivibrio woodruffii]TCK59859.1 nucleoside ABC transporter ATP-binding protein [Seleniivibrio woodruffii]TVZ35920.1 nucleoside ABC transporter ATP-binding protein [Seleniivibrio woodruffii]
MEALLKVESVVKTFPGVKALDGVCLNIFEGEIHTLLGENGAGKSTLMNVLNGLYSPDGGTLRINGQPHIFRSPKDSIKAGIGMVHQHFMLVYNHTVFENILLSVSDLSFWLNKKKLRAQIQEIVERFGLQIELDEPIRKLSIGQQQWVELIKLLIRDCKVLILDEPTAVLTPQESDRLFGFLKQLKKEGRAVIFISHKMREVMELSDRVTVLKKGTTVQELVRGEFDENVLAGLMIGTDEIPVWEKEKKEFTETVLNIENLNADKEKGMSDLIDFSLALRKGEILGIAGVAGNGQKTLAEVLTGLKPPTSGKIFADGRDITNADSRKAYIAGIAHVPEDRKSMGIAPEMSVDENLILKSYKEKPFRKFVFQNFKAIKENAEKQIESFAIKAGPKGTPIRLLSGGNIQKVIIARELSMRPSVLVALYPTRGLDMGSAEYVHKVIMDARKDDMSTIVISEDLDELLKLSDRIAVMFRGRITGIVDPEKTSREEIGLLMSGETAR